MTELMIRVSISREMGWLENIDFKDYDIIVSGNVLEGLTKRITVMLRKLNRPYVIDPHTYVFGDDVEHIDQKRWFNKLVEHYGLDTIIDDPDDFELLPDLLIDGNKQSTVNLRKMVKNVMNYQRTRIQETYDNIREIEEFDNEKNTTSNLKPKWIIPPYFFMRVGCKDWRSVNIASIKLAVENKDPGEKIFAVIMLDKEILSCEEDVDEMVKKYSIDGVDGYMVWCADLDENTALQRELVRFRKFIEKLATTHKPIHNMYGGLFSLLLENKGLTGTSHSICYGEHKIPFSRGGGGPTIRFYQPYLHSKIPLARKGEIEQALELERCDCKYCVALTNDTDGLELELTGKHFLVKRIHEIETINTSGSTLFLEKLVEAYKNAIQKDRTGAYANHYERFPIWSGIINDNNA